MEISVTAEFKTLFSLLPVAIKKKVFKQQTLFCNNPFHNSLNTEKLEPKNRNAWSFRVDKNYRIVFRFLDGNEVLFLVVGPHKWIYRMQF